MRNNAWITVERTRALRWREWVRWSGTRPDEPGHPPEPEITAWEKKAAQRLHDMEYIFKRFLRPTIQTKVWIMLSIYDVTQAELASGYSHLGDAAAGGDFGVVGYWKWEDGQHESAFVDLYPWMANQVLKFMPPTYDDQGDEVPAVAVRDVNVLFGQPPREFPA